MGFWESCDKFRICELLRKPKVFLATTWYVLRCRNSAHELSYMSVRFRDQFVLWHDCSNSSGVSVLTSQNTTFFFFTDHGLAGFIVIYSTYVHLF